MKLIRRLAGNGAPSRSRKIEGIDVGCDDLRRAIRNQSRGQAMLEIRYLDVGQVA
jgi:hypothetical protein